MKPHSYLVSLALAVTLGLPAWAAGERIAIVTPPGVAAEYPGQLKEALCVSMNCIPAAKVTTGGRADFGKASGQKLTALVAGKLSKGASGAEVELTLYSASGKAMMQKTMPANDAGRVSVIDLVAVTSKLHHAIEHPDKAAKEADKVAKAEKPSKKKAKKAALARKKSGKARAKIVASKPSIRADRS